MPIQFANLYKFLQLLVYGGKKVAFFPKKDGVVFRILRLPGSQSCDSSVCPVPQSCHSPRRS